MLAMPKAWAVLLLLTSSLGTAAISAADDELTWLRRIAGDPDEGAPRFTLLGPESSADASSTVGPDWVGLTRDTAFLIGYQLAAVGTFYLLPESVSKWSSDEKDNVSASKWFDNVKHPTWDEDNWFINYVGHSYAGAIYYIRARERGFGKAGSFVYATVASAAYEFGVEALFERPSYQDLIVTPVGGALVAMLIFEPLRTSIKAKAERRWYDEIALFVTDPLGVINGALERLLGIQSEIRVSPRAPALPHSNDRSAGMSIELRIPWP
jgi:hypothetical protein